jgi:hypothetical protein
MDYKVVVNVEADLDRRIMKISGHKNKMKQMLFQMEMI